MRIFKDFPEAFGEIKRDLKEMGIKVHTKTMQNKNIDDKPEYDTLEIMNYIYTVTNPWLKQLSPTQPWADIEWRERLNGILARPMNPGEAYKLRPNIWNEFIGDDGLFDYTYSERLCTENQVLNIVRGLQSDSYSRQAFIPIWESSDSHLLGSNRVPCSLGYHFMFRDDALHMTYFMRSCDFFTHFQNDIYLALCLQKFIADQIGRRVGRFTQFMASLHVYEKDVEDVF